MLPALPVKPARWFYATSLIAFGVQHFLFTDFIAGRAPAWPAAMPGQMVVAYLSGLILIAAGLSIFLNFKPRLVLLIAGTMILAWAGLRNIYAAMIPFWYGGILTSTFKALSIGSGAFVVAYSLKEDASIKAETLKSLQKVGIILLGLFLLIGGIQHFIFADFVKFLVPAWIPGPYFWTYFAGVALIAAGLGLITGLQRKLAALLAGWMVFIWFIVLHIPLAIANPSQNEWTAVFEALAVSGLLFVIYWEK